MGEIGRVQKQRTRAWIIGGCGVAVVGLSVLASVYVFHRTGEATYGAARSPAARQADGAIIVGGVDAKRPRVEIFEDFGCPTCNEFEKSGGNTIKRLAAAGKITVWYESIWLSRHQSEPMRGNSQRAANAALCAPAHKWLDYHDMIYAHQPAEGTKGFSNESLIGWARQLGFATPSFERCVTGLQRQRQLNQLTDHARDVRKLSGTPTVFLNGTSLYKSQAIFEPEELEKKLLAAPATGGSPA
ncbi:DsbA family protein [Actinoallomurus acaciae]|uniref:DsbA family protein n=1 Tax=Actinoallomurus acaciae TaxID=502577 RepID=A0ABV5Y6W0_9ACTN